MSSFEECSTIYSWVFSTYMYMYLPLSSRERRLGTRPAVHVLQTTLRRFSPGEKHVDKNFSCAGFNKDIAKWENSLSLRKRLAFRDCSDGFPAKWRLRKEGRIHTMTRYYPDLGSALFW